MTLLHFNPLLIEGLLLLLGICSPESELLARKRRGPTRFFHPVNISDFYKSVTHYVTDVLFSSISISFHSPLFSFFSLFPSMPFFSLGLLTYSFKDGMVINVAVTLQSEF